MAVDPITPAFLTAVAAKAGEEAGKELGKAGGKKGAELIAAGWVELSKFFRGKTRSTLGDLRPVHDALANFSIGKEFAGGDVLAELPYTDQTGPWTYEVASFDRLFQDFFRPSVTDPKIPSPESAAVKEWKMLDSSGSLNYWRGRGQDFHLANAEMDESNWHPTIKTMFPFVTLGIFDKPKLPNRQTMSPIAIVVKMFVDGWIAFLDSKTAFEPRVLLSIANQAYIDGDFSIRDVAYMVNSEKTIYKDKKLTLYRRLMITETKTKIVICMVGVPHVFVPANQTRSASPYYANSERLLSGIHILKDF